MKPYFSYKSSTLDAAGATVSLSCAIHCALLPFVITFAPLIGLGFLANETAELVFLLLSATLGIVSLCLGYRAHRSWRALAVLAVGLALAATGHIAEHNESSLLMGYFSGMAFVVVGALAIALSHLVNFYLCQSCPACHNHGSSNCARGVS